MEKILIAADSFKGSLSSLKVARAIEEGIKKVDQDAKIIKVPIADGGEGTVEALSYVLDAKILEYPAKDGLMNDTTGILGHIGDTAILECASPSGLDKLDKDNLRPLDATSYGVGQMIEHALDLGVRDIYIGIGGSAFNDGGIGMALALGAKITDKNGDTVPLGAKGLEVVDSIDISTLNPRIKSTNIHILCDVQNPLTGVEGATYIYGPQKGVTEDMLPIIDSWMESYGEILKRDLKIDIVKRPGAGAAGGLGAALVGILGGRIHFGIDKILEMIDLKDKLKDVELVYTGEGQMDVSSKYGKAPIGVAKLAEEQGLPVIAIVGAYHPSVVELYDEGLDMVVSSTPRPMSLDEALNEAFDNVKTAATMSYKTYTLWK